MQITNLFKSHRTENFASAASPLARRLRRVTIHDRVEEAKAFLDSMEREGILSPNESRTRKREVCNSLRRNGWYEHTPEELNFGARVAWRNHARCIGRLYWDTLKVVDCRGLAEPDEIAGRVFQHMRDALGNGKIESIISVFPPMRPGQTLSYIESRQICQYAGYLRPDGSVLGDRQNIDATRIATSLGFQSRGTRSAFDMLPLVIRDQSDRRHLFPLPDDSFREISIKHPGFQSVERLGLKWFAVPCVSGMTLTIGGIEYPCAPFNGFYMCTEIASRDLADVTRYDILPAVSHAIGDHTGNRKNLLWQDRALTELNLAVIHSFRNAGVSMIDHHTASQQFTKFCQHEAGSGRHVSADWNWIVPPESASYCSVYHQEMEDHGFLPNYYHSGKDDGARLMPYYGDRQRSRARISIDNTKRRLKLWIRSA